MLKQYRFTPRVLGGGGGADASKPISEPSLDETVVKDIFAEYADIVEEQYGVRLEFARVTPPAAAADGSYECTVHYNLRDQEDTTFASIQPAETTAYFLSANNLLAEMKAAAEQVACGAAYNPAHTIRIDTVEGNPMIRIKCQDGTFAVRDTPSASFRIQSSDPLDEVKRDNTHRREMELQDRTRAWEAAAPATAPATAQPAVDEQAQEDAVIRDILASESVPPA